MAQITFLAILPFALPALAANIQARNNWGVSSVFATPSQAFPSVDFPVSSVFATPSQAFPSADFPVSSVFATPSNTFPTSSVYATVVPTSYFDCGGHNFTVTASSGIGAPTGVTTVTVSATHSGAVPPIASTVSASAAPIASSSRLAARNNWPPSSAIGSATFIYPSSSAIGSATVIYPSSSAIGSATVIYPSSGPVPSNDGTGIVCPFPTSTVFASGPVGTGIGATSAGPSGTTGPNGAQLGQQAGGDAGAASVGQAVSAGSVFIGALAVVAQFL